MKVNPKYKAKPYSTWCYQLAAYRAALGVRATCLNLIVNSVAPEAPIEHVWSEAEWSRVCGRSWRRARVVDDGKRL